MNVDGVCRFGVSYDHDAVLGLMRVSCADGRVVELSGVPLAEFERLVRAVSACVRW